jgi:hypothetical protein
MLSFDELEIACTLMSSQIPHFLTAMNLSVFQIAELSILTLTTLYHRIACYQEKKQFLPPGSITGQQKIHWYEQGSGDTTIVIDSSLGSVEGYLLINKLADCVRVIMFDRPGYGWSPGSWQPRTSQQINNELQALLQTANIQPPYILIGDLGVVLSREKNILP